MAYIIDKHCSTCHYCYNECPVHAIRFVGVEYAIDQDKCIGCGKCEKVCPAGAITNTEATKPEPHDLRTVRCDAVVVGGGGAGLVAAVRFAELTGKRVVVLEKAKKPGGNTTLGHNFILRSSKVHAAAGYPDHRAEHAQRLWESAKDQLSRDLVYKATYAVTDMFDWLYDHSDLKDHIQLVRFADVDPGMAAFMSWGAEAYVDFPRRTANVKSTDHSMGPGWMGTFVVESMLARCRELGVTILTEHAAKKLLLDDSGAFRAVLADDPGGQTLVEARCCLLASGGFSNGKDIMDRVLPAFNEGFPTHTFTMAANTGDAIHMVEEIGGAIDLKHVKIPLFGPTHHPFAYSSVCLARCPEMVMVNTRGERFTNEGDPGDPGRHVGPMESQPNKIGWAVVDAPTLELLGDKLIRGDMAGPPVDEECMRPWREQLEEECTFDLAAKKADTLEELAEKTGVDKEGFLAQIARYNADCAAGQDSQFGKAAQFLRPVEQGPFYALFLSRFNEGAEGGLVNDDDLRVLDRSGKPFPGLYTAGDCCRGLLKESDEGGKFGEMGWAMASGFLAAQEMAGYLDDRA